MIFRQLFDSESCTYTYLIACSKTKTAAMIDPVKSHVDQYIELLAQLELKLLFAIDTHVHADHITALKGLQRQTGCTMVMGEHSKAKGDITYVKDREVLPLGEIAIEPIYTPGHTDDSYCFLVNNYLFTGDTLLIRGTGRTDFQHGSSKQQFHSLFQKILMLPEDTLVYPGHDYQGYTMSTIGEEKKFNPRLQVKNQAEYTKLMAGLNLPKPKLINIAVPANLNCGDEPSQQLLVTV